MASIFFIVSAIAVWAAFCGSMEAGDSGYVVTWSEPGDLDGFENPEGQPAWVADGGSPGGFMKATRTGGSGVIVNPLPFLRLDWGKTFGTKPGTISFHVMALSDHTIPAIVFSLSDGGSLFRYVIPASQTK